MITVDIGFDSEHEVLLRFRDHNNIPHKCKLVLKTVDKPRAVILYANGVKVLETTGLECYPDEDDDRRDEEWFFDMDGKP